MRHRSKGFTLIEVLVAFAILALMLGPILHSFSKGTSLTTKTEELSVATALARSNLDRWLEFVGAEAGTRAGSFENTNFDWRLTVEPLSLSERGHGWILYRVTSTVTLKGDDSGRSIELVSLRIGNG